MQVGGDRLGQIVEHAQDSLATTALFDGGTRENLVVGMEVGNRTLVEELKRVILGCDLIVINAAGLIIAVGVHGRGKGRVMPWASEGCHLTRAGWETISRTAGTTRERDLVGWEIEVEGT